MTSSIQSEKQNSESPTLLRPTHQGRAFKLELGHNNGPYLAKDIMHSNKKSLYLIAAKQILQSQMSMSNLMSVLSKEEQNQSKIIKKSFKVQNWFSKCQFLQGEIKYMDFQFKKLATQSTKLKRQLKSSFIRLVEQNQDLCHSFLPLFKNLLRCIRDQNTEQKNIYQERKRDIEYLTEFRNTYLDQLVDCETRIIKIQQFSGINEKEQVDF